MAPDAPEGDLRRPASEDVSPEAADPVTLVARIAESLPALDADALERLAQALDELTEAVGLAMEIRPNASDPGERR